MNAIFFTETICTESSNLKHNNKTDKWREYSVDSREWRAKDWMARWRGGKDGGAMMRLQNTNRVFPSRAFALMAEARKHSLD